MLTSITPLFMAAAALHEFSQIFPWSTPIIITGSKIWATLFGVSYVFLKFDFNELVCFYRIITVADLYDHINANNIVKIIHLSQHWRPENINLGRVGLDSNGIYQPYIAFNLLPSKHTLTLNPDKPSYVSIPSLEKVLNDIQKCVKKSLSGKIN